MNLNNFLSSESFIFLLVAIIFFIVVREILTWYWKINKAIRILERIERNTRKDGVKYPDEEFDEEYFKRNNIKIPGENTEK
ncbi:MAG: hypothetical protein A3A96_02105 [Candidatus Zambryskibacteria bacterium RIFCSPLOWO2_01_FULL_39_39]|uniref:Uncharacterized protein n=1 Tax=Candidatus Zambryskibacteria bacterium RIFCSPLOWO2_01_FULL_39_39 TaxID=1802758 RepID=A0A1G2TW46_9BACT|nr:MAG: hypothetical protein A2644_01005 [Candidatus Zambryskibacteria bacterium RIFCSPHIGHO2_01_FULL_39_63]OHA94531.1 MAG: hypothetical protein A3B88_01460 [Candidatus Zambryskibacteria bacterium RIFCSPHIGHO2_02_FULL_39_19]OHA97874.1 MAG: hypothetical protein A3F20_01495 [Candidatus Zambryskibacteria bacterium RIFCSPHIGHO2_12_FULL_39_21]OHB01517.1 MAG: hypothetical protein A3A96_02105 [Candidatus Zambryskibacteria bacterium RIFCSPLOWO2_01_FULL_39_39]